MLKHGRCIVYPSYEVAYVPVPKAGCAGIQAAFLKLHGIDPVGGTINSETIHRFLFETVLKNGGLHRRDVYDDYFKFTVVRNPFSRVLSSYVNKFVLSDRSYPPVRKLVQRIGHPPSFRDFVHYLSNGNTEQFDEHWKPQSLIIHGFPFDHVGKLEDIDSTLAILRNETRAKLKLDAWNRTEYSTEPAPDAPDTPADRFTVIPSKSSFFDAEIIRGVLDVYLNDFNILSYSKELPW